MTTNQNTGTVRNDEMNLAWRYLSATDTSVFLTGKAGTGKTTFLRRLRELSPKRMAVLAPTGVAAINAGGQTIHSFFQLPFGPYVPGTTSTGRNDFKMSQQKKDLIRTLDLLVIDEVSMVRADLLDQIDNAMRRYRDATRPFGGVQLLLIGDLMQLAPVAKPDEWAMLQSHYETPYFFSSHALASIDYVTVELRHIYRQQDTDFINLLAKVRDGRMTQADLQTLNSRHIPGYMPEGDGWIRLTTHNLMARQHNDSRMRALSTPVQSYACEVEGEFPEGSYPNDEILNLKVGAQVMFVKNDTSGAHAYYNGKIGVVTAMGKDTVEVTCKGDDSPIKVVPVEWENTKYELDASTKEIRQKTVGVFRQLPLRLAWAITIHKSQGLTFDKAVLDIDASFSHGQAYVALSRCRTLDGIVLATPVGMSSVITDMKVKEYTERTLAETAGHAGRLPELVTRYATELVADLYSFVKISNALRWVIRVVEEHLYNQTDLLNALRAADTALESKVTAVAAKFAAVCAEGVRQSGGRPEAGSPLALRMEKSYGYFADTLREIFAGLFSGGLRLMIGNKQTAQIYENATAALRASVAEKQSVLQSLKDKGFSTATYLDARAKASIALPARKVREPKKKKTREESAAKGPAKQKKPKTDTVEETLTLYRSGLDLVAIAKKRGLTLNTITGHISKLVAAGKVDATDFVTPERMRVITDVSHKLGDSLMLSQLKDMLPDDITYTDIHIALAYDSLKRGNP